MALRGLKANASQKERLLARVGQTDTNGCWPWSGGLRSNGYGMFAVRRDERWSQTTAHRVAYEEFIGPIPEGYEVDHLCQNRGCVNPDHLEAVTLQENRKRRNDQKTHCKHGHPYTPETTRIQRDSDGYKSRICRICENARHRVSYKKRCEERAT